LYDKARVSMSDKYFPELTEKIYDPDTFQFYLQPYKALRYYFRGRAKIYIKKVIPSIRLILDRWNILYPKTNLTYEFDTTKIIPSD
jgi:hypothetical protein